MRIDYNRWLVGACAAYMALSASNFGTFWRSCAFTIALVCTIVVVSGWRRGATRPPLPPASILLLLGFWLAWSLLSWTWSAHRDYTLHALKNEVLQTGVLILACYVAAGTLAAFRTIATGVLVAVTFYGTAAVTLWLLPGGWDPIAMHDSNGHYSTFVVVATPWLLLVVAPAPTGFGGSRGLLVTAVAMLALLLLSAYLTATRVVWVALFGVLVATTLVVALRWPRVFARVSWRAYAMLAVVVLVIAASFVNALVERAKTRYSPGTSVETTLERDPRLVLWAHLGEKLRARPLTGYGFGRLILADELSHELGDPLLTHAHNVFASQWLQTGLPGMIAFALLLIALVWRFTTYVRSRDDGLALLGLVGIAVITGFVLKNVTDDFLFGSNSKELWLMLATLLGYGECLARRTEGRAPGDAKRVAGVAAPETVA